MENVRLILLAILPFSFIFLGAFYRRHEKENSSQGHFGRMITLVGVTNGMILMVGEFLVERFGEISFYFSLGISFLVSVLGIVYYFQNKPK